MVSIVVVLVVVKLYANDRQFGAFVAFSFVALFANFALSLSLTLTLPP